MYIFGAFSIDYSALLSSQNLSENNQDQASQSNHCQTTGKQTEDYGIVEEIEYEETI